MFSDKLKRLSANVFWLAFNRVFRMAVGVVVLGAVGRYLGPASFGVFNYAVTLATLFVSVATLGFEGIVIRELVRAPDRTNEILGTAFWLRLGGGFVGLVLVLLTGLVVQDSKVTLILALIVSMGFFPQSFEVIDLWFQKNIEAKFGVFARLFAVILSAGIKLWLVAIRAPLSAFAVAVALDAGIAAVALIAIYRWRGKSVMDWKYSGTLARRMLKDSWPLVLSGVLVGVYVRVEQFLVMSFLGESSMGIYFAALRVSETWGMIPMMLLSTVYPMLAAQRERNPENYRVAFQTIFDGLTILGFAIALVMSVISPWVVKALYGAQYSDAAAVLIVQAWCAPIVFSGSVRGQYFLLENLTIYHTFAALIGIAVNFSIGIVLMARFGTVGAALGALIGYLVAGYVSSFLFASLRPCGAMQTKAFLWPFRFRSFLAAVDKFR